MSKFKKIILILVISSIGFVYFASYIYLQVTPRALGQSAFPLKENWRSCVDENIKDVSANKEGKIFVSTSTALRVYDQNTGILIWYSSLKNQGESFPPVATDERIFTSDNEYLWAFDLKTGETLWKVPHENTNTWIPAASERFVILNFISDLVEAYDVLSGSKLWGIPGGRGYTQAYIEDEKIYIVDRGIKALNARTGKLLWQLDNNRATDVSAFGSGILYYTEHLGDETFDLVAYDVDTKRDLWRKNFTNYYPAQTAPAGVYAYDNLLFMTQYNAVYRINPENGKTIWKKELYKPENLSLIENKLYAFDPLMRAIHALDVKSGADLGSVQISFYQLNGIDSQRVTSTENKLVFTRGCEVFVYGK